jgi:hypothetical protein
LTELKKNFDELFKEKELLIKQSHSKQSDKSSNQISNINFKKDDENLRKFNDLKAEQEKIISRQNKKINNQVNKINRCNKIISKFKSQNSELLIRHRMIEIDLNNPRLSWKLNMLIEKDIIDKKEDV